MTKGEKLEQRYANVQVGTKIWKYAQEKIGHELRGELLINWVRMNTNGSRAKYNGIRFYWTRDAHK
jgi:hypothetical protein